MPPALRWTVRFGLGLAAGGLAADALPGTVLAWAGAVALAWLLGSGLVRRTEAPR